MSLKHWHTLTLLITGFWLWQAFIFSQDGWTRIHGQTNISAADNDACHYNVLGFAHAEWPSLKRSSCRSVQVSDACKFALNGRKRRRLNVIPNVKFTAVESSFNRFLTQCHNTHWYNQNSAQYEAKNLWKIQVHKFVVYWWPPHGTLAPKAIVGYALMLSPVWSSKTHSPKMGNGWLRLAG